jgi:broad specificity phosphatase PhoE
VRIYLARHGQAAWQLEPSSDLDTCLTALGHDQSRRLAMWLVEHRRVDCESRLEVATLCSSPLSRARETAEYASRTLALPAVTLHSLCEADFHVADHLPSADTPLETPERRPLSSTYAAFKSQAQTALAELVERAGTGGGPVLAITHGGIIKTILRVAAGTDDVCFRLYNTGLNLIEWRRGRWHLVYLNLLDHLPPELRSA